MKLTYLTHSSYGRQPDEKLAKCFDETRVIEIEPYIAQGGLHTKVDSIEKLMQKKGSCPFDIDDFVLGTAELGELCEVIGRNRLNCGVERAKNYEVCVGYNDYRKSLSPSSLEATRNDPTQFYVRPSIRFGGIPVMLINASKLPLPNSAKQRILFVAPHFEEETALYLAYLHKKAGDDVHITFVTDIPNKPGYAEKSHKIYQEVIGLSKDEYSFMGIKERTALDDSTKIRSTLQEKIEEFKPDTMIAPPGGSNFDHNRVLTISYALADQAGLNFLLGECLQNTRLKPSIWTVIDWDKVEKITWACADECFGGAEYKPRITNLFKKLPEALNRYVASLKINKGLSQDVGVFGLQPVVLEKGYRVPHNTVIFGD